ncbi:uncharacterized protein PG998_013413 [Apiospora kogelbergensis]|uniref:uncharacterized protein n=1 Tax=Apiospora kogelbergensis TaxID=1337665 RepID=UPI00312EE237
MPTPSFFAFDNQYLDPDSSGRQVTDMPFQRQGDPCIGSDPRHAAVHRSDLSGEEQQDDSAASVEEPLTDARGKRSMSLYHDSGPSKRPRYGPATPQERSVRSSQVADVGSVDQEQQLSGMRPLNVLSAYEDLHVPEFQFKTTATGLFTPTSTMHHEYKSQRIDPGARCQRSTYGNNPGSNRHGSPVSDSNDDYPIDPENENDMLQLLNRVETCIETQMPPSSVLNRWDRDSRSADVYDQNLQHSPLQPPVGVNNQTDQDHGATEEDSFLDEDVDWDAVYDISSSIPKDPSPIGSQQREEPCDNPEDIVTACKQQSLCTRDESASRPLDSSVRPQFHEVAYDRSVLPGVSPETALRTCFCNEDLLIQAAYYYSHSQEVVFALYAKVKYSKRESLVKKQYFLLVDLYEDQKPHLLGALSGWRPGDSRDPQGQALLEADSGMMCRCMCKAKRSWKNTTGWILDILDISVADLEQIRHAEMVLAGDSNEH